MNGIIVKDHFYWRARLETNRITQRIDLNDNPKPEGQLQTGTTLSNRYLIQGVLGVGGMGAVYRARDLHFPNVTKLVAVKEMVNQARDPLVRETIVRNFEREANILATLSHPAIPRIYDYFTHNERSYLIEEFIDGKDLEAILTENRGFFSEEQIVSWGIELCDVLNYLHTRQPEPIVFRDMKPSNVMVNQYGHIVLVDFGIAKPFQSGVRGTMIGTEGYSPPEQYRGEANALADIYALGATLHHLVTRRDPRLEAPFSFAERPIRRINPNISPELELVIQTALQYTPENRYPSAQVMKEALLEIMNKSIAPAHPAVATVVARRDEVKPLWVFKCEDEIRGSASIDHGIVYVGSYDHNLYALESSSGKFLWKYPTDAGVVSRPAISEGMVYIGSEDHRLHVVSARNGSINWTYYTNGPVRSSPHLAEAHVFIGSDDCYLHAVNMISGRMVWKTEVGAPVRSTPLLTNEAIYFGTESGDFYCLDFRGAIKWRFKAKRAITSSPIVRDGFVYFSSLDGTFYALDAKTGWVVWRFRLGRGSISTPSLAEDLIFTGCIDGNIYSIETRTSKEKWKFSTEHQVTGSPIVHKDSLYCGSVDGHLYCLEYRTGRLRWKFKTEGPITSTPLAHADVIYIGSTDHRLYALSA
jgi:serine/threonine protein kinase